MVDCSTSASWLPYVQPFGTVCLGFSAAFIAFRQWRTADEKVRLDLYNFRQKFLIEFRSSIDDLQRHGADNFEELKFRAMVLDDRHLFAGSRAKKGFLDLEHICVAMFKSKGVLKRDPDFYLEDATREKLDELVGQFLAVAEPLSFHLESYVEFSARALQPYELRRRFKS